MPSGLTRYSHEIALEADPDKQLRLILRAPYIDHAIFPQVRSENGQLAVLERLARPFDGVNQVTPRVKEGLRENSLSDKVKRVIERIPASC